MSTLGALRTVQNNFSDAPFRLKNVTRMQGTTGTIREAAGMITEGVTSNGLRIVTNTAPHVESVTLSVWINAGSREDPDDLQGLAHVVEHAVFKGTPSRDYISIARCMEDTGGYIDAWTTKENTCLCIRCLREHLDLAFSLLSDLCCNPLFPEEEIDKEKEVIIDEIQSITDSPEEMVFDDFDLHAFENHPLGLPILGTEQSIEAITTGHLQQFMQSFYTAPNMVISAVGKVSHEDILSRAETYFSPLRAAKAPNRDRRTYRPGCYTPFSISKPFPSSQAQVLYGTVAERCNRHFYSLLVLNTLLGTGMSSTFNLELREKNALCYNVYTSLTLYDDITVFNVYAGTDNSQTGEVLDIISDILQQKARPFVSRDGLERAKQRLTGAIMMGMEKMTRRMSRNARDLLYFGRVIGIEEKIRQIDAITPEALQEAATYLFHNPTPSTLIYTAEEE